MEGLGIIPRVGAQAVTGKWEAWAERLSCSVRGQLAKGKGGGSAPESRGELPTSQFLPRLVGLDWASPSVLRLYIGLEG